VIVVGAGLAGTATAIRLLRFARGPLEVVLLERRPDYRSAGVAYHRDGNPWGHVFNIQAGRMSAFREDVHDFLRWANCEADREDWPPPWAGTTFTDHGPAPRRIFQDYLADRLAEARREACPGVVLVEADGEAVDLRVRAAGVEVTVAGLSVAGAAAESGGDAGGGAGGGAVAGTGDGAGAKAAAGAEPAVLLADHVVLATGLELREPAFAAQVREHPSFVRNPYSEAGVRRLVALPPEAAVAIVGSVLSAYDAAGLLLRQGHTGTIHLISRSGTVFQTYPGSHAHEVVRLPCPQALLEPYGDREEFVARVRAEWRAACSAVARDHPEIHPVVVAERVTKAWEPHLPKAVERIPSAELRGLLDEFGTALAAYRVSAVEYTMAVIERAMRSADGPVELVVGKVEAVAPAGSGRLAVSVAGPGGGREVEVDLVVSNFGRESDYSRVDQPLWRNLLSRGTAVPHRRTGRGLEVDERGALLGLDGEPVGPVSAVGVLREGDEIVRNGRIGAFTFNVAAIKNHSVAVAAHVVEGLELRGGGDEQTGNIKEAAGAEFEQAVALEVKRLATRTRTERELLDSRLDSLLRKAARPFGLPMDAPTRDRLLRLAVNRAAVEKLTDVSVTPGQLRRQLGIADSDERED
jgi:uncharacterized NAD(P)/FAD-binding protein YdhS